MLELKDTSMGFLIPPPELCTLEGMEEEAERVRVRLLSPPSVSPSSWSSLSWDMAGRFKPAILSEVMSISSVGLGALSPTSSAFALLQTQVET